MPFATPLALLGLLFVPLVVAMYLLKLRRDQAVVPSTLLWSRLLTDVEANAPWQRLRRSLLLLLQLLLVLILALLAARPFLERPAGLARDIVLIVDASASMAATDVAPDRMAAARDAALEALRDLPAGGKVSVIAAGHSARIVSSGSTDLGRVRQAIASIEPVASGGDLGDALRLADALAARSGDAEILVATDAALGEVPTARVGAPVRVLQVGRERRNQAIVALGIRTAPSGLTKSAFISIANLDIERAEPRIEVYGDGILLDSRDLSLDAQARAD
nr:VWA domain-containing protein [Chloroflexota bacterium]